MFVFLARDAFAMMSIVPAVFFQFHLETGGVWMCKLGVISQERLKIAQIGSHNMTR